MGARPYLLGLGAAVLASLLPASAAYAQQVTVERDVTIRSQADRHSNALKYVKRGDALTLLDSGARQHGYYHVQLGDGRTGWVYQSFVAGPSTAVSRSIGNPSDVATVHFIDVDQANSALLEFPCAAVLIDTGARDAAGIDHLIHFLEAFFARRTDLNRHIAAVFITHTHVDHNRALKQVAQQFHVDHYIHDGMLTGSGSPNAKWMLNYVQTQVPPIPSEGVAESDIGPSGKTDDIIDPVKCSRVDPDIRVLSGSFSANPGWQDGDFDNQNNHSLVIKVSYGLASFLFTGDLEKPAIETLLERATIKPLLRSDVWLVGHHGSDNGTTPELLAAMNPQIAIFSAGDPSIHVNWTAWAYGHPRRSVVEMIDHVIHRNRAAPIDVLVADGAKSFSSYHVVHALYATAWDGDIDVAATPDGTLQVTTSK
jgi:beta-lactamase superfamily II metal-dependent hydrolase